MEKQRIEDVNCLKDNRKDKLLLEKDEELNELRRENGDS